MRRFLRVRPIPVRALLLALVLLPGPAAAGALDDARAALAAGRPEQAIRIIATAGEQGIADPVERDFLIGLALIDAGKPEAAVAVLSAILARDPGLTRVRLELARALYLAGDREAAARQFRQVLGADLPPEVRRNVLGFLEQIDRNRRWSGSLSVGVAPDSNVSRGTESPSITLFGQRFDLSEETRRTSGIGFEAVGTLRRIFGEPGDAVRPAVSGSLAVRDYANDTFDDVNLSLGAGLERRIPGGTLYAGPRVARRWFGGAAESDSFGVEVTGQRLLAPSLLGFAAGYAGQREDRTAAGHDPTLFLNTLGGLAHPLSARTTLTGRLGLRREFADPGWDSLTRVTVEASLATELPRGFRLTLSPGFAWEVRDEDNPLFDAPEDTRLYRGEVTVSNRLISLFGFSPAVSLELSHQEGEVVLDEYDRARLLFSVERSY